MVRPVLPRYRLIRHQFAGVDPARAGRGAGLAVEAEREIFKQTLRLIQFALLQLADQSHAATRRGGFEERFLVGRTGGEAHAAAHTVYEFDVVHN